MKTTLTIALLAAGLTAGAAARAEDECYVPMTDWQPRAAVAQFAADQGWTVRKIRIDDGCYEIVGTDADGRAFDLLVHPTTLAVIGVEYDDDKKGSDHEDTGADSSDD